MDPLFLEAFFRILPMHGWPKQRHLHGSTVDKSLSENTVWKMFGNLGPGFALATIGCRSMRFGLHEEDQASTFEFDFKFNNLDSVLHRTYILRFEMRRLSRARGPQVHAMRLRVTNRTV